eukprot:4421747-Pyramimonas_sp.AAC.1
MPVTEGGRTPGHSDAVGEGGEREVVEREEEERRAEEGVWGRREERPNGLVLWVEHEHGQVVVVPPAPLALPPHEGGELGGPNRALPRTVRAPLRRAPRT